jgi:outer membrane cobalamin receptor
MRPDTSAHAVPDSLFHYTLPVLPGSLNRHMDRRDVITDTSMEWYAERTLNEVVAGQPGIYGSDPSGTGQYFPLSVVGAGMRSNTVLVDGRPMADPASGIYALSMFPMDMAEQVEVVAGPRSFLYGTGSAGSTINIVTHTPWYRIPFTKIRYEEAVYDHTSSSGSFSQNLTRRTNLSFGYQYLAMGLRNENSAHEQWNFRGALRYHLLPNLSVILSEHYAQTQTGLNGGINFDLTGFSKAFMPAYAKVYSTTAYEKLTRHDVDVRFVGSFLPDSADLSTLSFYYSGNLREYRDVNSDNSVNVSEDHRSSWSGVRAQQNATIGRHHLSASVSCELRQVEGSPALGRLKSTSFSGWAMDDMELQDWLHVAAYARSEAFNDSHYGGLGADMRASIGDGFTVRAGASLADRAPSFAELWWADSTVTRPNPIGPERHLILEAGLEWSNPDHGTVSLMLTRRRIANPILTAPFDGSADIPLVYLYNGDQITTLSTELSMRVWLLRHILVEGSGTYMLRHDGSDAVMTDYPKFWGQGGIYLAGKFFGDKLDLKAGARGHFRTSHDGYFFSARSQFAVPNTLTLGMASTVDLLAVAHIGSAYVHIMWENVTSVRYFSSAYTPALERAVRFGISWEFSN